MVPLSAVHVYLGERTHSARERATRRNGETAKSMGLCATKRNAHSHDVNKPLIEHVSCGSANLGKPMSSCEDVKVVEP